ncbi:SOS response-associated peptidase family protein [uncultured Sphingomonas sp.]|uniref:SOS response-associated peptidase family protein n=1 Tax=uncultured Sphingomonas sp. TaxID=158754 RepID=UPI0026345A78|nr:SOS response-associated peptidase family protein [uncultured Sphingomonas sp.]
MDSKATPFDSDAPGSRRAIIRRNPDDASEIEMIEAAWGSDPRFSSGVSYRFIRSEGQSFPGHRCLIPASEFHMTVGDKRFRVALDDGNHFYIAAIWEPAMANWQTCFRVITMPAGPDVARYQERHGAIILRRQVMQWLDATVPETDLFNQPPRHSLTVEELVERPRQASLAL